MLGHSRFHCAWSSDNRGQGRIDEREGKLVRDKPLKEEFSTSCIDSQRRVEIGAKNPSALQLDSKVADVI